MKRLILSSSLLLTALPAAAQSLKVTGLTQAAGQITFTIENTGSSTSFRLESSPSMSAGTWSAVAGATFAPVAGQNGFHRTIITRPAAVSLFYRVVGLAGTAEDTDGDGLSNTFEATIGTNPALYDTDGDGFNDGLEFSAGTDPILASSFPDQITLPTVEFMTAFSAATEGTAPHLIPLKISGGFSGEVSYSISPRSTLPGSAHTGMSGTVVVSNGVASISLNLVDDLVIQGARMLMIDLKANLPAAAYRAAGAVTHVVNISDNDGLWSGVLKDSSAERNFRMRLLKNATTAQVEFLSGGSDGLLRPDNGASSQSTGVIPSRNAANALQEVWPASPGAVFNLTPPAFGVTVAGLPDRISGYGPLMSRSLVLTAVGSPPGVVPPVPPQVQANRIVGNFTETVTNAASPGQTYLNTTVQGSFVLVKDMPALPLIGGPLTAP